MCSSPRRRVSILLVSACVICCGANFPASACAPQEPQSSPAGASAQPAIRLLQGDEQESQNDLGRDLIAGTIHPESDSPGAATADTPARGDRYGYGLWVLAPALVVLVFSLLFRQVVPGLFLGILTGAYMLTIGEIRRTGPDSVAPTAAADSQAADAAQAAGAVADEMKADPALGIVADYARMHPAVGGFRYGVEQALVSTISSDDRGHQRLKLVMFLLVVGFAAGVTGRNGGMAGLSNLFCGKTASQRRGLMATWLSSVVVCFEPTAGRMTVGPMMQLAYDRTRMSRAKLAYLVDATAASVGSLVMIGAWVVAEIALLSSGLGQLDRGSLPPFLAASDGTSLFLGSIGYRFYAVFALALALWIALLDRDFGPMWWAESRALSGQTGNPRNEAQVIYEHKGIIPRAWIGLLPVLTFVGMSAGLMLKSGWNGDLWANAEVSLTDKLTQFIRQGDPADALFYGAWGYALLAFLLTFVSRAGSIREASEAGLSGMGRMVPAIVALLLSLGLARVCGDLHMTQALLGVLHHISVPNEWMPLVMFAASAVVALLTGSAWTTAALLTPVTVALMAGLVQAMPAEELFRAEPLFYSGIGAVVGGALFGAHCSPMADTTIITSAATGCRHEDHVITQLPYALAAAVLAAVCGYIVTNVYGQPWHYALPAGCLAGLMIVLALGRRPRVLKDVAAAIAAATGAASAAAASAGGAAMGSAPQARRPSGL
ncbi:MAG: hypothetical protein IT449_18655 [Phycisphaerales bacterium]|nr:hypothetical protein [Phycisphaerales bacterium]